jgi:hypothetical protein
VSGVRLRLDGPIEVTLTTDATGTAHAEEINQGHATHVAVSYDTGIR